MNVVLCSQCTVRDIKRKNISGKGKIVIMSARNIGGGAAGSRLKVSQYIH